MTIVKYSEILEAAIPLVMWRPIDKPTKEYSCDALWVTTRGKCSTFVLANKIYTDLQLYLEEEFGIRTGEADVFNEFYSTESDGIHPECTAESQKARIIWLTFAAMICKERGL